MFWVEGFVLRYMEGMCVGLYQQLWKRPILGYAPTLKTKIRGSAQ